MTFYPMLATGVVMCGRGNEWSIGGTCAAYENRQTVVTAAHCVPEGVDLQVELPGDRLRSVDSVHRHPTVDIAVLTLKEAPEGAVSQVYRGSPTQLIDGGDFVAYGYPVESGPNGALPVGRMFKGHFQRTFGYTPPGATEAYLAGEMSVPAPAGLSGGPVTYAWDTTDTLVAIVTANIDSYAVVDSYEETEEDGRVNRGEIRRVVSYGIAALMHGLGDWLAERVAA